MYENEIIHNFNGIHLNSFHIKSLKSFMPNEVLNSSKFEHLNTILTARHVLRHFSKLKNQPVNFSIS